MPATEHPTGAASESLRFLIMENAAAEERWSLPIAWIAFVVVIMAAMAAAGVFLVAQTVAGRQGPPLFFLVVWFAVLGWNVYMWLFRVAYRVELSDSVLTWRAPLAGGRVPVSAIDRVGRYLGAPNTCVLRADGHRSVIAFTQLRSFDPMLRALNRFNAAVPPRL